MVLIILEFLAVYVIEGIVVEGKKKTLLMNIHYRNWINKQGKPVAKAVYQNTVKNRIDLALSEN